LAIAQSFPLPLKDLNTMPRSVDIKAQLWAKRFREFEASPLSVEQFCKFLDCSPQTFYQWKRKLAGPRPVNTTRSMPTSQPTPPTHSAFLQVQSKSDCSIQLKLVSGVIISIPVDALDYLPQVLERIA
jgi:hypothetical protein